MGYEEFAGRWQKNAGLAWDTISQLPTKGIPNFGLNVMEWSVLEELSGHPPGSYRADPTRVYLDFQLAAGACLLTQWIPENPLSMTAGGFDESTPHGASTGAESVVVDGIVIDSPEAVVEHLERVTFPAILKRIEAFDRVEEVQVRRLVDKEVAVQRLFGTNLLKGPYDEFQCFPYLEYTRYGYANYFCAYALYPEVMERHFRLQGDYAARYNAMVVRAIIQGGLPKAIITLDHDMADSRGTLVDVRSLDKIWFPHFARSIEPFRRAGIKLMWHCDGNLMQMVPRLLEAGLGGFQGFQYEDGMDYERICRMKDRDGNSLMIMAGVSVTRTLPFGTPEDVVREMKWLVDHGPRTGLFLAPSSSVAPRTPIANIKTLIEGFAHYREHGRGGSDR